MKRKELLKRLSEIAKAEGVELELVREGGSHTVMRIGDRQDVIPRHREINERTAKSIIKKMEGETS